MSEERRSADQLRKEIHANAKDVLGSTISERGLVRSQVIASYVIAEILLDIREHLDGIECSANR